MDLIDSLIDMKYDFVLNELGGCSGKRLTIIVT